MNEFEALTDDDLREKLKTADGQDALRRRMEQLADLRDGLGTAFRYAPVVAPATSFEAVACRLRSERMQCEREIARIAAALNGAGDGR